MNVMNLGPQMAKIRVDNQKGGWFLTLDHGYPPPSPLKNQNFKKRFPPTFIKDQILKSGFVHAREDQKKGLGPN